MVTGLHVKISSLDQESTLPPYIAGAIQFPLELSGSDSAPSFTMQVLSVK